MNQPIFSTSPINKIKVIVGWFDVFNHEATFEITEKRFFKEAGAVGIDENVFKRKTLNFCNTLVFKMWTGEIYRISKKDFMERCWIYPPGSKKEYKANRSGFIPKLMITEKNLKELNKKRAEKENEEILRLAVQ